MTPAIRRNLTIPHRRLLAGFGVLVFFAVFFALPLYAAVTICTMPCCHHNSSSEQPVVSAEMLPCGTDCSVRADEATATASSRSVTPPSRTLHYAAAPSAVATSMSGTGADARIVPRAGQSLSAGAAPLHVLNSVFRI